jgi:hypothetical protein
MLRRVVTLTGAMCLAWTGCGGSQEPQPQAPQAPAADEPPPTDETSTLDILCEPPTKILLDGKPIGTSPIKGHKVSPGAHDVTFADEQTGNRTLSVKVAPGESRTVISDKPPVMR